MNKTITLQLSKVLAIIVSLGFLVTASILVYWSYQPSVVLTVNNGPVPIHPPEVKDGDKVYLTIDFCQAISSVANTRLRLIGETGALIGIKWPSGRVEKGCNVYKDVPIIIPGQTPSDTYYAEFTTCYDVNPIKSNQCTTFTSQPFKVVNPKLSPGDAKVVL